MRRLTMIVATALLFGPAGGAAAGAPPEATAKRLAAVLDSPLPDGVVGEALAVIGPGGAWTWSGAAGHARSGGEALKPTFAFRIASVTKPYVAAAILRLAEDGRVDIDAPVGPLLSPATAVQLASGGYDPGVVTVRQLLNHTSGLPDHSVLKAYIAAVQAAPQRRWTRAEQIALAMTVPPVGRPGQRFSYSDTGYVILGEVVERLANEPLGPAVRRLLDYQRLGLGHTYWETMEPAPKALPHAASYMGPQDFEDADPSFDLYGGGGIVSTVEDLARFYRALVLGDVFKDRRILAVMMSVAPAERPATRVDNNAVHALVLAGHVCWGHTGFWGSVAGYCPTLDIAFAFTRNQAADAGAALLTLNNRLGAALDGPPFTH